GRPPRLDRGLGRAPLRCRRDARGARARGAQTHPDARPRDPRVARRALRPSAGKRRRGALAPDRAGPRASWRVPRRPTRAAVRPRRGARGDPASASPCAPRPAPGGHRRALLRLPAPAAPSPSRPPTRRPARGAGRARAPEGRGLHGAPVGEGPAPRARRRLRAGVARPAGTHTRRRHSGDAALSVTGYPLLPRSRTVTELE